MKKPDLTLLHKLLENEIEPCPECNGDGWVEVIDEKKVNSQTIDIPYKKIMCEECLGEGYIETEGKIE